MGIPGILRRIPDLLDQQGDEETFEWISEQVNEAMRSEDELKVASAKCALLLFLEDEEAMRKGLLKVVFLDHWGQTVWDCWISPHDYLEMTGAFADGMRVEEICSGAGRGKIFDTPGLREWSEESGDE
jgi:hypothetical protein